MKGLLLAILLLICTSSLHAQTLDDLILITEEYPPFNFFVDGKQQGISTDLLVEMFNLLGSKQTREDIGSYAWARGYQIALHNRNALLYSTTRTESREELFKWVGPIINSEIVLLARKDRQIKLKGVEEINQRKLRVGVVLNDVGEQTLRELGVKKNRIYRFNMGVQLAEMLQQGRIDLLAYGKQVSRWNLKTLGYAPDDFEAVYILKPAAYYYALNKKADPLVVSQLQTALDQLKEDGTLDRIIKRYLD